MRSKDRVFDGVLRSLNSIRFPVLNPHNSDPVFSEELEKRSQNYVLVVHSVYIDGNMYIHATVGGAHVTLNSDYFQNISIDRFYSEIYILEQFLKGNKKVGVAIELSKVFRIQHKRFSECLNFMPLHSDLNNGLNVRH